MLGSAIEKKVCVWVAKKDGIAQQKLIIFRGRGFPDRTFFIRGGIIAFIEFKGAKEAVKREQKVWHNNLTRAGFPALISHDYDESIEFLSNLCIN